MSELDEVASLLKAKTLEDKISWKIVGESRISTHQGLNIIEITQEKTASYSLSIRNMDGILLVQEKFERFQSHTFDTLDFIFLQARRSFLGVDRAISDVRQRLLHL